MAIKQIIEHNSAAQPNIELLQKLQRHFPQFFDALTVETWHATSLQFNTEKFLAALRENNITEARDGYRLSFVGKDYARLQTGMMSETLIAPDTEHNNAVIAGCDPQSPVYNRDSQNIFITGDNLEALRHLQNAYTGKIKMIYIDPPYNTGKEFVYNDHFEFDDAKLKTALGYNDEEIARLKSIQGKSSHSAWLTFMYPRLKIAQKLLTDDGVIFVSIDDNEQANLKLLMDDVFGEGNFRNCIAIRRGTKSVQAQFENIDKLGIAYEYVLMYSKNTNIRLTHFYFDLEEKREGTWNNHWRGTDRPTMRYELLGIEPKTGQWRWAKERSIKAIENYERMILELEKNNPTQEEMDNWYLQQNDELDLLRLSQNNKLEHYVAPTNQKFGHNLWTDIQANGTSVLESLDLSLFDNPKNPNLIKRMLKWLTKDSDIILDFFAGSATTAHAVMQLNAEDGGNRKFIMVQLDEPTNPDSEARKAGYNMIDEISRERIKRAAKKILSEPRFSQDYKNSQDLFTANNQGNPENLNKIKVQDNGFRHYRLKSIETQTLDKITEFDPNENKLFEDDMIAALGGLETILTTWLIDDGYDFQLRIKNYELRGYNAPYIEETGTIYLIDKGFGTEQLKELLNRIGKGELAVSTIVVFPYSFTFEQMLELKNNVKNNLDSNINIIERY